MGIPQVFKAKITVPKRRLRELHKLCLYGGKDVGTVEDVFKAEFDGGYVLTVEFARPDRPEHEAYWVVLTLYGPAGEKLYSGSHCEGLYGWTEIRHGGTRFQVEFTAEEVCAKK